MSEPEAGSNTIEARHILRFGDFRADLVEQKLWKNGDPIHLTPKVFQIFAVLLRNRDRAVTKRELLDTVWPDCFVDEANLTQNISVLRKALGETTSANKYIATFQGRGYRFIASVIEEPTSGAKAPSASGPRLATVADPVPARARRSRRIAWAVLALAAAGIAIPVASRLRQPAKPVLAVGASRAITHLPGREFQPVISPSGTRVAFVHDDRLDGLLRVGVADLGEASRPRFVSSIDGDAFSPAWSPDGLSLAYLQSRGSSLALVLHELAAEPRDLLDLFPQRYGMVEHQLDWSPDGRLLAVSNKSSDDEPFRIELIHIEEGRRTPLTVPPALSDGDFEPRFSPDGKHLAFLRINSKNVMDIFVVEMPGGLPAAVTDNRQLFGGVGWTPDSGSLLFTAEQDGVARLWRTPVVGGRAAWQPTDAVFDDPVQISVSRLTGKVALAQPHPDQNIWRARFGAGGAPPVWDRLIASTGHDSFPVWSPDGRRVVFLSDRSGGTHLWLREANGNERQLTSAGLRPSYASWTGSGEEIVFSDLESRRLFRLKVRRGKPVHIPIEGRVGSHTAISPDDSTVFLVRRFYLFQAPATGGRPEVLTDQGGFPLRMSPDGEWIYYTRHRFSNEIWRARQSTGQAERITSRLQAGCWACWSVNNTTLVYIVTGSGRRPLLERLDLASRQTSVLGVLPGRNPPLGKGMLALAPTGDVLLADVAEPGSGDIRLVEAAPWVPQAAAR